MSGGGGALYSAYRAEHSVVSCSLIGQFVKICVDPHLLVWYLKIPLRVKIKLLPIVKLKQNIVLSMVVKSIIPICERPL